MFAKVAIDLKNEISDVMFTYSVPEEYQNLDLVGVRVLVEFGFQKILGYVLEVCETCDYLGNVKPILEILDIKKEINKEQIELAKYISESTVCTLAQSLQLMVPSFLRSKYRKYLIVNDYSSLDANLGILLNGRKKIQITKEILDHFDLVKKEIAKGNLEISYDTFTYGKMKKEKEYFLNPDYDYSKLRSLKRKEVCEFLFNNPFSSSSTILENTNISELIVRAMESDKILKSRIVEKVRNYQLHQPKKIEYKMNLVQEQLLLKYNESSKNRFLLYTNDEVFKYNFLIEAIRKTIKENKKVFIVAPTILSYINTLKYIKSALTDLKVLNFSLKMSNYDFYENYVTLKSGDFDVVCTSKVGLFLPLVDCGLMIMLDEDNYNYISEQTPKYDSHKVMEFRANYHDAKLIYTSNTPSLGLYHDSVYGKVTFLKYNVTMNNNYNLISERNSTLVGEFDKGLSKDVLDGIKNTLKNNKKVILIINHKGFSRNIVCRKCGESIKCPRCKIPYTYYKDKNILKCNYCDNKIDHVHMCPSCGSPELIELGVGLEQVRQKIALQFPKANVIQIDSDTLTNQKTYEELIMAIEDESFDIIVGTSLTLSCANYSNIGMVALLDCDGILNIGDYRSSEECFKLIAKLSSFRSSDIYLQGLNLSHYAIELAVKNDYQAFYQKELVNRQTLNYFPFSETSRIIITGEYKDMYYYANYFKKVYKSSFNDKAEILGPTYSYKHRGVQLILKHNDFDKLRKIINDVNKKFEKASILVNYERYPRAFN